MARISCSALLIDMDGVLVDSTAAIARVWTRWCLTHGFEPESVIALAHGRTSLAAIQQLFPNQPPEFHLAENRWMEQGEIEDHADVIALPGSRALLESVPADRRTVVTSATRALAEVRLRAAGLWDLVRHLVTASDIRNGKPDPEPYLKGAAALPIAPQECVVIEDAASGTRAGKAAGARVIAIRTTSTDNDLLAAGADWLVNDCASLRCSLSQPDGHLVVELPEHETPATPRMR